MKKSLLGISLSLFGIALILCSGVGGEILGLGFSFLGLLITVLATYMKEERPKG
jgi:hypothetical protein